MIKGPILQANPERDHIYDYYGIRPKGLLGSTSMELGTQKPKNQD